MELDQFRDVDLVIDRANDSFVQKQFVSQGDYKGRTLTVQVTNNGNVGEVPGLTLNLNWHNEASGLTDLSAFTILDKTNSIFRIEYPEHMMTPGKVIASIQVIQDGKVTNLKQFELTVQNLAGQPVGIVEKAEFSALVAVLADSNKFRTDIDALETDKADKIDLAQTNENIEILESTKADKTALAQTNASMATNLATKVDKEGNEQVTLRMLSQEVKTAMTGGSVAVVGPGGVNTSTIVDGAVTDKKVSAPILKAMLIPHIIPPNYDTTTKTLTFNGTTGSQDIITWGNSNYTTNTYSIPVGTKVLNETAL
ncbi:BppU family phage baseplate upper protein, partial [Enterococcus gallinarum]|uniref:BppU family phage baseplate upper protein n=2 Tax=Enterococcus gallinarum TaxID=1353 RepID=UPI0032E3CEA2